jgi:sugar O-acyltransferase (sialic acid O-acetyltransferase NeuD family)
MGLRLLIVGAGGHGAVVAETAAATGSWKAIEFIDDKLAGTEVVGFAVLPAGGDLGDHLNDATELVVAVGNNARRLELLKTAAKSGASLAKVIHPSAQISGSAVVDAGCVVFAGVVVNARAKVGVGTILNSAATVDHDCVLGDGVHVSPGANLAGGVTVGECSWIGIGSAVREGVTIGDDVMVAAGAAVVSDIPDRATVGGVPARILRSADDE